MEAQNKSSSLFENISRLFMDNWKDTFVDGASGALAGFISALLLHPLENIRARLQDVQSSDNEKEKKVEENKDSSIKFKDKFSSIDYLVSIMKKEGIFAFYKGLPITLIGSIITFGIYFFCYKACKVIAQMQKPALDSKDMIIITTVAGCICNLLTTPVWIIQTRMCVSKVKKSILDHCRDIWKEGKLAAFWKGFLPGLILVSNPVINFVIYEKLRTNFVLDPSKTPTALTIFFISLIGKFAATIVTYPILTLKTKAFTNSSDDSTMTILSKFLKNEGVLALFRGLYTKLFQTLLANAFMMVAFEKIREFVQTSL